MSKIEITNSRLATAVRTNDAMEAFSTAVENGQARLALDILENIIPVLVQRIETLESSLNDAVQSKESAPVQAKVAPKAAKENKETKDSSDTASE